MKRFLYVVTALFLLGNQFLTAVQADRWMSGLKATTPLNEVIMPGTHDSATDKITFQSPVGPGEAHPIARLGAPVVAKWSRAQGKTITEQLNAGIRYLDLRTIWDPKRAGGTNQGFYSVHMLEGQNMQDIINQVHEFVNGNGHENEIVILDFNHFYNMDDAKKQELADMIKATFGAKKLAPNTLSASSEVGQFLGQGREYQVIVLYDHQTTIGKPGYDFLWSQSMIFSEWPNAQTVGELKPKLDTYMNDTKRAGKFFVTQGILTPDAKMIAKGLMPSFGKNKNPGSLEDLAKNANQQVCSWLPGWKSKLNIVIADYFGPNSCLESVINLNF